MVYFPTFGWFLGHMLVNTSGIPYMEHSGICWYANMTMKQKIGGMPIFYAHYMRASIIFNPFLFDPAIPQSQFSRSLFSFWGEKLYIFPFSDVFSDGSGTQNLQQTAEFLGFLASLRLVTWFRKAFPTLCMLMYTDNMDVTFSSIKWQGSTPSIKRFMLWFLGGIALPFYRKTHHLWPHW